MLEQTDSQFKPCLALFLLCSLFWKGQKKYTPSKLLVWRLLLSCSVHTPSAWRKIQSLTGLLCLATIALTEQLVFSVGGKLQSLFWLHTHNLMKWYTFPSSSKEQPLFTTLLLAAVITTPTHTHTHTQTHTHTHHVTEARKGFYVLW